MVMSEKNASEQQIPGPVPQMVITANCGNRNVKNLPLDSKGRRGWSYNICGCCGDCSACCFACFCPCIQYAKNQRRLEYLNTHGIPDPRRDENTLEGGEFYAIIQLCFGMGWIFQIATRKNIRERYGIRGNGCDDCCAACCCTGCDLLQGHRELKLEEESFEQSSSAAS